MCCSVLTLSYKSLAKELQTIKAQKYQYAHEEECVVKMGSSSLTIPRSETLGNCTLKSFAKTENERFKKEVLDHFYFTNFTRISNQSCPK